MIQNINARIPLYSFLISLLIMLISFGAYAQKKEVDKISRIRIFATDKQISHLQSQGLIHVIGVNSNPDFVDVEVLQKNIAPIKKMGMQIEMIVDDMSAHHTAQASLEKAAKGKKVKKPEAGVPTTSGVNKK